MHVKYKLLLSLALTVKSVAFLPAFHLELVRLSYNPTLPQCLPKYQQTPPLFFGCNGSHFPSGNFDTADRPFPYSSPEQLQAVGALSEKRMPYQNK